MCGIAGILYFDPSRKCDAQAVTRMCNVIRHRGPDDEGIYVSANVGLGHRRLSIIDLATGHQPMVSNDEPIGIVFNGEIYNYKELRAELIRKGFSFRTESDTEVILNLYLDVGKNCVRYLNGMFAFAIWDGRDRSLFLARDHMGIKPLYYAKNDEGLVFASEIKALFQSGLIDPVCNRDAIPEYLLFRYIAGEKTLFKGVQALLPGNTMSVQDGKISIERYWSPATGIQTTPVSMSEATRQLETLLRDAIKRQMISDVPLGTFCSGGLDSSLVTAIAAEYAGPKLNTFSVGFHEPDYDETRFARMVAKKYNTVHHEIKVDNREFSSLLPKMIWHNDEPLNFTNSIQIYALSSLAKKYVTVVLTGEGSDELFGGYPRYYIPRMARALKWAGRLAGPLLDIAKSLTHDHRFGRLKMYLGTPADQLVMFNAATLPTSFRDSTGCDFTDADWAYRTQQLQELRGETADPVIQTATLDQMTYLVSILNRQDKMSMAASIEARVPYLDVRLVEFANRLPPGLKLTWLKRKVLVGKLARGFLPGEVIDRRKSGFGVPVGRWMRADQGLGERVAALPESDAVTSFIDRHRIRRIVDDHRSGRTDHSEFLWAALNLALWHEQFGV